MKGLLPGQLEHKISDSQVVLGCRRDGNQRPMKVDKDRPSTWLRYRDGLCQGCYGGCCTMPVEVRAEDLVRLGIASEDEIHRSKKKLAKRLQKEGLISSYREGTDVYMLTQKANDDCIFLDLKTRLCSVYDRRPDVCRKFPEIGPRPGFCPASQLSKQKGAGVKR